MRKSFGVLVAVSAIGLALAQSARAAQTALSDAEVLGIYIQVNGFDVETALLARAQASTQDVQSLAKHVSSDHIAVRQAAFDLAATCKVSPLLPTSRASAAVDHGKAMATLDALTGKDFDKAYLEHEVAFHRSAIAAVRQLLLPSATCGALKAHFKSVLPALEKHLSQTETLAREFGTR